MDMLRIEDLTKSFGSKKVLDGVDLTVPEGSIFGFIGKNGAGKTTTMKMVLGLLAPDAGSIEVAGEKVSYGEQRQIGSLVIFQMCQNFTHICRLASILHSAAILRG